MEGPDHKISARERVEQLYELDHKHLLKYLGFYIDINYTLLFTEYRRVPLNIIEKLPHKHKQSTLLPLLFLLPSTPFQHLPS